MPSASRSGMASGRCIAMPRLSGHGKHHLNYRHIIDSLVRKPGAFENYRYREELFPTSYFRMAYDLLRKRESPASSQRISADPLPGRQGERERGQCRLAAVNRAWKSPSARQQLKKTVSGRPHGACSHHRGVRSGGQSGHVRCLAARRRRWPDDPHERTARAI